MNFYIIIPAHNEADFISSTLKSLVNQTLIPQKIVVVNDNSTDETQDIVQEFVENYSNISIVNTTSSDEHIPGTKVINAFNIGLESLDSDYDIICKFDADIILPKKYLEKMKNLFENDSSIGIAGGLAYIKKNDTWVYENISNKNHVRGPFKAYRNKCFEQIGGLKASIGWDTVDVLLANFYGWKVITDKSLHVKHLKPTGIAYNSASKHLQGEAMYKMRYGFVITLISALKFAYKKKKISLLKDYMFGYFKAKRNNTEQLVTKEQGLFIRKLRWNGIMSKFHK